MMAPFHFLGGRALQEQFGGFAQIAQVVVDVVALAGDVELGQAMPQDGLGGFRDHLTDQPTQCLNDLALLARHARQKLCHLFS